MKTLFNEGWEFCKQRIGSEFTDIGKMEFVRVNIPHDWLIYDTDNLYEGSTGWYRKAFELTKDINKSYEIYFEGVYMDSTVYLNGKEVGCWKYGYSSFYFDISDYLVDGTNEMVVKVNHQSPNSRWYSGAGIFRDVYFIENSKVHIVTDSIYFSAKPNASQIDENTALNDEWKVYVSAELSGLHNSINNTDKIQKAPEQFQNDKKLINYSLRITMPELKVCQQVPCELSRDDSNLIGTWFYVTTPSLWSIKSPKLYDLKLELIMEETGEVIQCESLKTGFRSFVFDCNKGMFLNGEHIKVNGSCEHHDLGAIGSAFNRAAARRRLEILRGMGINAIRTSHNMPAVGLLELTDEMGFLVMDEAFDMWESSKTTYDYGRFFKEWYSKDVRSWIRRDRNHPSIFMWSIGNEIYDTHKDAHGEEITRMLMEETRKHDPLGNGVIGMGSNFMPWENTQHCADILKYAGYNYAEKIYDAHHAKYPDWHIFGSETSSTVQSRGIYHFPYRQSVLADDDWQCSALGNSTTSWGAKSSEACIMAERDHEFSIGQFLWSGTDYIGEPTPYQTRNSYFGQIDTAGFPKDSYYIYKSAWISPKEEPFVHLFPYWDFSIGQKVDVRVATNGAAVELFLNGKSLGKKLIDHEKGTVLTGDWVVVYEPGEITAVAFDENGAEIARDSRHSFGDSRELRIKQYRPDREIKAGAADMIFAEVYAVDKDGYPVENANDKVFVMVEGGELAGLDNGDSTDTDQYKGYVKRLFSGKMLISVYAGEKSGDVKIIAKAAGLKPAELTVAVAEGDKSVVRHRIPDPMYPKAPDIYEIEKSLEFELNNKWIRKIELSCESTDLGRDNQESRINAKIYPEDAAVSYAKLQWKAVTDSGISSPIANILEVEDTSAALKAVADGVFHIRAASYNGCPISKVSAQLELKADGLGEALLNPYGFIAGGMFSYNEGEMTNGNEHGVATPRGERGVVGFQNINFGSFGADEITLSLFVLSGAEFPFQIWEGIPEKEGSRMLLDGVYQKECIWNQYQPETYRLNDRVKGITELYFVTYDKAHIGGFSFAVKEKAYECLSASECDSVYGDEFEKTEQGINHIGNNVTVEFGDMDFSQAAPVAINVKGMTTNTVNTIHLLFENENGESTREILEFVGDKERAVQRFEINSISGKGTIRFVFLPGSKFDFDSFWFEK